MPELSRRRIEWPAAFPVVRAYLDQLVRGNGLASERTTAIATALDAAEKQSGRARRSALNTLAAQVDKDASGAKDPARVKAMSPALRSLLGYNIWPPFMGQVTGSHPLKSLEDDWVAPVVRQALSEA